MRRAANIRLLSRLLRDRRGVSAIEFALIAPVMIVIYFGLIEFTQGYMAERRAGHVASMVADLVARSDGANVKDLEGIFQIGDMIMRPFSAETLSIRVSSVTVDARGVATVEWSRAKSAKDADGADIMPARKRGDPITDLPPDLITDGQTVILGETNYGYVSAFGQMIPGGISFQRNYYLKPRTTDRIVCTDC
ncbi:TadE/TadG family type IV pilus assembly protein [Brevundimonas diminuta]|uniref:Flp pilus assembly protein TadG n=1 Tax=Brevundimonas diminuta TaxID=293 RepID=A0A2X1BKG8_BREDI|nr:TadE/TadG family type IV pilus assembly protein [Brevundimonas diminuta]SPU42271.1 Flp pilus assembly protein TadG [Brevundimonas diminuta]